MTERQSKILYKVISDYINTASPISSGSLIANSNFDISPATMRIEMNQLEKDGYLMQPHVSSGSIPTDKAYRFFVDKILEKNKDQKDSNVSKIKNELLPGNESDDYIRNTQDIVRKLAEKSSSLALTYLSDDDFFITQGWENLLLEPEFREADYMKRFIKMINSLEDQMGQLCSMCDDPQELSIYIGKENRIKQSQEFSIIVTQCQTGESNKKAIIALMGPKRMSYEKNINLLKLANDIFQNF